MGRAGAPARPTPQPNRPSQPRGLQPLSRGGKSDVHDVPPTPRVTRSRPAGVSGEAADETRQLIASRLVALDDQADHYTLLGIAANATEADIRKAYFGMARKLHPDRLAALQIEDPERTAHRVMAQVNAAFNELSDLTKRGAYDAMLKRGGAKAQKAEEEMMMRVLAAEKAYERGLNALKGNQMKVALDALTQANELKSDEPDYVAALAWAKFCAASNKDSIAGEVRKSLQVVIRKNPDETAQARIWLGRVERMMGRDKEALRLFREVLDIEPRNPEATAEIRVIESRSGGGRR
jgi:tetratricopeptide (TPR) repeat protein